MTIKNPGVYHLGSYKLKEVKTGFFAQGRFEALPAADAPSMREVADSAAAITLTCHAARRPSRSARCFRDDFNTITRVEVMDERKDISSVLKATGASPADVRPSLLKRVR